MTRLIFDVETTTKNKGNPFTASNKLVSYSLKVGEEEPSFHYYTNIDFITALRIGLEQAQLIVGFNVKFDIHWARRYGCTLPSKVRVWDCQIAEFILRGQKGSYPSLDECLEKYGLGKKDDKVAEYWKLGIDTDSIPVDELRFYNNLDVELTGKLYEAQLAVMTQKQRTLCYLMGLDLLVLADMERNGIKFDVELCKTRASETEVKLKEVSDELLAFAPTPDINLDSGQQLSCFLYGGSFELTRVKDVEERTYKSGPRKGEVYYRNVYETTRYDCPRLFNPLPGTEYKNPIKLDDKEITVYQSGEDVLKQLKRPTKKHKRIIELLLQRAELAKLLDTYYGKIPHMLDYMEWGDYLHGQYNQTVAATGRLSSSAPNMQNFSGDVDQLLVSRYT